MKTSYRITRHFDLEDLAIAVKGLLSEKGMETQLIRIEEGEFAVQAKDKDSYIRKIASMEKACTVLLKFSNGVLEVETGQNKWLDKAAGAAIGWFVFWPALVTSAYGAYKQHQLPKEIHEFVQLYVGVSPVNSADMPTASNNESFCTNCGEKIAGNAVFCHKCGNKIQL